MAGRWGRSRLRLVAEFAGQNAHLEFRVSCLATQVEKAPHVLLGTRGAQQALEQTSFLYEALFQRKFGCIDRSLGEFDCIAGKRCDARRE